MADMHGTAAPGAVRAPAGTERPSTDSASDFARIRREEYARLDREGVVYLDYTGSGLAPASLIRKDADRLLAHCHGNPHSKNGPSRRSTEAMEGARARILEFFGGDPAEWSVVFTANASGGLRLVGEAFPFGPQRPFALLADDHNSVQGIREWALRRQAPVRIVRLTEDLRPEADGWEQVLHQERPGLLAYPLQSNFSGVRHELDTARRARALGWRVLLDTAAWVPTSPLDLSDLPADFVAVSFYKMFGYPTGVGALIGRRDALAELERPSFAGGTVEWVTTLASAHALRAGPEAFEDGTPNFLAFAAVTDGLDWLAGIGMARIKARIEGLQRRMEDGLRARLWTGDGAPGVRLYGRGDGALESGAPGSTGGTISFNVLHPNGDVVHCERVEDALAHRGIAIRAGCFCNPGAAERAFDYEVDGLLRCLRQGAGASDLEALARCSGRPAGALRGSVGVPTSEQDVDGLLAALDEYLQAL